MKDARTRVAQALNPLSSEFKLISGQMLKSVFEKKEYGCIEKVIFNFEDASLVVFANGDDDTIDFKIVKISDHSNDDTDRDVSSRNPWDQFIGRRFCWGWMAIDQQGYLDSILLSFDIIFPNLILNVAASSIDIGIIIQINTRGC